MSTWHRLLPAACVAGLTLGALLLQPAVGRAQNNLGGNNLGGNNNGGRNAVRGQNRGRNNDCRGPRAPGLARRWGGPGSPRAPPRARAGVAPPRSAARD